MKLKKAKEELGKLDIASKRRLQGYYTDLRTDVEGDVFDDKARDFLLTISKDGGKMVHYVNGYLDGVKWNQSTFTASHLQIAVGNFCTVDRPNRSYRKLFKATKEAMIKELKSKGKIKMLEYRTKDSILDALPRLDTHAGFSWVLTGKRKKGDYSEEILEHYLVEEDKARKEKSFNKPILIGSRTQGKNPFDMETGLQKEIENIADYLKTRLVSMIDIYLIIAECKFAKPFQNHLSRFRWYMGGKSDAKIHDIVRGGTRKYRHWMSLDYSAYDQSIPAWLIREAFDIVRAIFDEEGFDNELFTIIREDFIHKVFLIDGDAVEAHKGVPSGSMFTQIIDSLVNKLMIGTYMREVGIDNYETFIMGDDNLIFTTEPLDKHHISDFLKKEYGITMHPLKVDHGDSSRNPVFLSRIWTPWGVFKHPRLLIAKLIFPEKRREYKRYGFTPAMVVESYFQSFYLGMIQVFDYEKQEMAIKSYKTNVSAGKWATGLMRYQQLYENEFKAAS